MPRIHSWREVIAPRDCWCILHRTTLRPAASSATSTSSSLEPPSSPTRFPPPLAPPWRNEQRAISLLLNACHKSPRAPSRSPSPPRPSSISSTRHPVEVLSLVSPLLPRRLHPHLHNSASRLLLSPAQFLCTMFHRFYPPRLLCIFSLLSYVSYTALTFKEARKRKSRTHRVPILHFLRHYLKKNNDERVFLQRALLRFYAPFLFSSSSSLFLCDFLLF